MQLWKGITLLFLFFFFSNISYGQSAANDTLATITEQDEQLLLKADELFDLKNYVGAMPLFDTLSEHYHQSVMFKFKTGICFLHASSKHIKALSYLEDVKKRMPEAEGIDYYLGKAYLLNYRYDEAINAFSAYSAVPKRRNEKKIDVAHLIDYCKNGKELIKTPVNSYIENIGKPVNTDNSEYVPVISSDESFMIFTYRGERSKGGKQNAHNHPDSEGEYYEDIFISYKLGDHWLYPEPLGNINTINHDAAIALSVDGQKLFIFKATNKDKGDIYVSELKGLDWSEPQRLNQNVNTNFWEGSITMSSDEKTIYFASDRPGGYGARDIYKSRKQANGDWGPAENLGPLINTQYNEDAPFLHPNSKLLYFSSEGHNSIGGYDIFVSELVKDVPQQAQNLGFPINTSSDDKYISISTNGAHAYYSSGVDEGLGQQDIYSITPGILGKKPQVAVVKGMVKADEKAVKACIKVSDNEGKQDYGTFYSNAESGKYLLVLLPYMNYKISFEAEGFTPHYEFVNTASLNNSVEVDEDIHLYSAGYDLPKIESKDSIGFIYTKLEEEISKLDSIDLDDDHLLALAHEREAERRMNVPKNSTSFRIATEATVQKILAQNSIQMKEIALAQKEKLLVGSKANAEPISSLAIDTNSAKVVAVEDTIKKTKQAISSVETSKVTAVPTKLTSEEKTLPVASNETPVFGIYYKVQIGAYRHPQNFKYPQVKGMGIVEKLLLKDGITRFTIGNFENLSEAQALREKIIGKGIKDAWITATVNGERKLLEELQAMTVKTIN